MASRSARRRQAQGGVRRRGWMVAAIAAATLVALIVTLVVLQGRGSSRVQPGPVSVTAGELAPGAQPPDFTASTFDGQRLTLSSLRGKPVLINFFASWCTSCRAELPAIEAAYQAHRDQGFTVVGVNTAGEWRRRGLLQRPASELPAVFDPGTPGKIGAAYLVTRGLPVSVFLDRQGRVALVQVGGITALSWSSS